MNVFPLTLSRTISLSISLSSFSHNSFFLSLTLSRPSTYISLLIYYSFISPPLFLFLFLSFYSFLSLFPLSFQIPFYLTLLVSLSLTLFHSSLSPFSPTSSLPCLLPPTWMTALLKYCCRPTKLYLLQCPSLIRSQASFYCHDFLPGLC